MHAIKQNEIVLCRLGVGREVTVDTIGRIRRQLISQLAGKREIEVDLSMVRQVDTTGVEGILALRREALRRDVRLRFVSRNEAFLSLLEQMERALH